MSPLAITAEWTYTVPGGRKCVIESVVCVVNRQVVATTPGDYAARIRVSDGTVTPTIVFAASSSNVAGTKTVANAGLCGVLKGGYQAIGYIADASVGGTVAYGVHMQATEFDA